MKQALTTVIVLAVLGGLAAAAVIGAGLYNVSARQGHLPGVTWAIHTAFKQSVRLRAPDEAEVPEDLRDPDRVRLGALHFKTACTFCHAAPGQRRSATALAMNPTPPHISTAAADWTPAQLYWIVHEGVKMTGMPHWPALGREDEVWSVVAYLDAVAAGMDGAAQAALAGDAHGAATCTQCHGGEGRSDNTHVPRLDILTVDQISAALGQYREGTRPSGFMQAVTRDLEDAEINALARRFGRDTPPDQTLTQGATETRGGQLALKGTIDVPSCTSCHGPGRHADQPIAPSLAGQSEAYLAQQLRLWRAGHRGGGVRHKLMRKAAQDLTDAEITTLARWFSGLAPGTAP